MIKTPRVSWVRLVQEVCIDTNMSHVSHEMFSFVIFWDQQMNIEHFAQENLNEHKKGLLGKAVPVANMLTWTKVRNCSLQLDLVDGWDHL